MKLPRMRMYTLLLLDVTVRRSTNYAEPTAHG
jgi:hypothetical protein